MVITCLENPDMLTMVDNVVWKMIRVRGITPKSPKLFEGRSLEGEPGYISESTIVHVLLIGSSYARCCKICWVMCNLAGLMTLHPRTIDLFRPLQKLRVVDIYQQATGQEERGRA